MYLEFFLFQIYVNVQRQFVLLKRKEKRLVEILDVVQLERQAALCLIDGRPIDGVKVKKIKLEQKLLLAGVFKSLPGNQLHNPENWH